MNACLKPRAVTTPASSRLRPFAFHFSRNPRI